MRMSKTCLMYISYRDRTIYQTRYPYGRDNEQDIVDQIIKLAKWNKKIHEFEKLGFYIVNLDGEWETIFDVREQDIIIHEVSYVNTFTYNDNKKQNKLDYDN